MLFVFYKIIMSPCDSQVEMKYNLNAWISKNRFPCYKGAAATITVIIDLWIIF